MHPPTPTRHSHLAGMASTSSQKETQDRMTISTDGTYTWMT